MFQKRLTWLGAALLALVLGGCAKDGPVESQPFMDWASQHAIAVADMSESFSSETRTAVRQMIGEARVVGLGESRHDTREQLIMKGLLIRCLVEDLGFRTLILEESLPHVEALDRYVSTGTGDPRGILNQLAGWYLWDTEEMFGVIQWAREFNRDRAPRDMLRLSGMDITAPALGVHMVLEELTRSGLAPEMDAGALGLSLQRGDYWPTTWQRYAGLPEVRRQELQQNYLELKDLVVSQKRKLTASLSKIGYERLLLLTEWGLRANEFFSSSSREKGGVVRERGMADAVLWVLEHGLPDQKAIVWAHNLHVAKDSFAMPGFAEGRLEPMGVRLRHALGDSYMTFGGAFGKGVFPSDLPPGERDFRVRGDEVMDGALARVGAQNFLLDLRVADPGSAAGGWLRRERAWVAQDMDSLLKPSVAFDAVYFVAQVTRARPTPRALRRFESLGEDQ
jgi:erythromycin esterase